MAPKAVPPQCWKVVGGADKGGILVREGQDLKSSELPERLQTGAVVKELQLVGDRLEFKKLRKKDAGPRSGWVSIKLPGKLLVEKCEAPQMPDFAAWIPKEEEEDGLDILEPGCDGWTSQFNFDRIANFRDVADSHPEGQPIPGAGGKTLKRSLLFRSGHWVCATKKDITKLKDEFGIKTYIDLRVGGDMEGVDAPVYDDYPPSTAQRHKDFPEREPGQRRRIWCPFTKNLSMRKQTPDEQANTVSELDRRDMDQWFNWWVNMQTLQQKLNISVAQGLSNVNRWILFINHDEVLKALRSLTDERNYPLVFGCVAGKDRTGIMGCLVLGALGVSEELIMHDYLRTNRAAAHISACAQVGTFLWHKELFETDQKRFKAFVKGGRIFPPAYMPQDDPGDTRAFLQGAAATKAYYAAFGAEPPAEQSIQEVVPQDDSGANMASNQDNLKEARVYRRTMEFTLNLLRSEGGVLAYLESIGFGPADVEKLRSILLE